MKLTRKHKILIFIILALLCVGIYFYIAFTHWGFFGSRYIILDKEVKENQYYITVCGSSEYHHLLEVLLDLLLVSDRSSSTTSLLVRVIPEVFMCPEIFIMIGTYRIITLWKNIELMHIQTIQDILPCGVKIIYTKPNEFRIMYSEYM